MLQEALARPRKLQMTPGRFWEWFPETLLETFPETFQSLSWTLARKSMWKPVCNPFPMPTGRFLGNLSVAFGVPRTPNSMQERRGWCGTGKASAG